MKISKKEWLIFGCYVSVKENGEIIIKNLKFKFNENAKNNINQFIQVIDIIDNKGYNLNARIISEFNKIHLIIETVTEKFIFKDTSFFSCN